MYLQYVYFATVFKALITVTLDSARGLFGHAASLVCNRLMASWKVDLNIALAAMEVLSGLARVTLQIPHPLMCKRTVNWICKCTHTRQANCYLNLSTKWLRLFPVIKLVRLENELFVYSCGILFCR